MRVLIAILPCILMIGTSNLIFKWRTTALAIQVSNLTVVEKISMYGSDVYMLLTIALTIASMLWWLYVLPSVSISSAYPMLQAGVILFTAVSAQAFLHERLSILQVLGILTIVLGITLLSSKPS